MKVSELIAFLKTQPQDLDVAYRCCSEQVLMEAKEITLARKTVPRADGWIQDARPDLPQQDYLLFPGN